MTTPTANRNLNPKLPRQFPCSGCGATLEFQPGTDSLQCTHCGIANAITALGHDAYERDYFDEINRLANQAENYDPLEIQCTNCAAMTTLPDALIAIECPFCGSAIVGTAKSRQLIKPQSLLPFHLNRSQALAAFNQWLDGLWFAPGDLRKRANAESRFSGIYLPCWLYDASAHTLYTGQRGDDYSDTEHYTDIETDTQTDSEGRTTTTTRHVSKTRQVTRTRWTSVSGSVTSNFDDVLIHASSSLPRNLVEPLEPWDLKSLIPYQDEYLSGFRAEAYRVNLKDGFVNAREIMRPGIDSNINRHIGGDHQRIHTRKTNYHTIKYQHILLPVWVSSFRYGNETFLFLINARTGEVQGKRPYSDWKIFFGVVLGAIAVIVLIVTIASFITAAQHR
jgi:LSD1 subclass zinc finger protein